LCPSGYTSIAQSLINIGYVFDKQGKFNEALNYHQRALEIREQLSPSNHDDIGNSLLNVGMCYEHLEQNQKALDYYRQTLNIYETNHYSKEYPSRVLVEKKILDVSCKLAIEQFESIK